MDQRKTADQTGCLYVWCPTHMNSGGRLATVVVVWMMMMTNSIFLPGWTELGFETDINITFCFLVLLVLFIAKGASFVRKSRRTTLTSISTALIRIVLCHHRLWLSAQVWCVERATVRIREEERKAALSSSPVRLSNFQLGKQQGNLTRSQRLLVDFFGGRGRLPAYQPTYLHARC